MNRFFYESYRDFGDTITDFDPTSNVLDLNQIFAPPSYSSSIPLDDYVQLTQIDSSTAVQIDPNGAPARNIFRTLVMENVVATNFSTSTNQNGDSTGVGGIGQLLW
ncbi:type I secretion C-terminal target domain-containing protein [Iningainema tapete]|uniref:Type I secretion C-terminal target domain-containing protein n=1 Tax=Iningainema tapete BLCC-T55 TaxID=2748662 RepID=A0A8J6XRH9_9CYAN|nr:type I secretion C-terminal target domain-containing protein [Iningainema tapete]MBD2778242.1 type I secretion C-terminal target domain-containing protein [Iningainema tapete BLCC-T55]